MPVAPVGVLSARSPSLPWKGEPAKLANATTCQPTTSAAITPIPNNHLVRLLTTHSPYLLISAPVAEPILERDRRTYLLVRSPELIMLFSLRNPLSLCRKRIDYWRLRVIECLQGSVLSCLGA